MFGGKSNKNQHICFIQDIMFEKIVKLLGQIFRPVFEHPNNIRGAKKTNTEYYLVFR